MGIDIKFLNDNLSFVVDFFKERRDNIFLQRSTIPSYAGWIENPYANLGVVENKGIELAMDYTQRLGKKTFLTVRGNLTFNKDKIIENDEPPVDYPWMETRGTNVNATWGFIADGLFTSQAEIEDHATQFGTVNVGDIKYRDLNGDGVIDNYDKTVIGRGDVPESITDSVPTYRSETFLSVPCFREPDRLTAIWTAFVSSLSGMTKAVTMSLPTSTTAGVPTIRPIRMCSIRACMLAVTPTRIMFRKVRGG